MALALALGLLAKPMLVTLPCVLLLLDYWPLRRWRRDPALTAGVDPAPACAPERVRRSYCWRRSPCSAWYWQPACLRWSLSTEVGP